MGEYGAKTSQKMSGKKSMDKETAKGMVEHAVVQKARWGKQWDGTEIGLENLLEALVVLYGEDIGKTETKDAEVVKLSRQLNASKAREARRTKERDKAREELQGWIQQAAHLQEELAAVKV